MTSLILDFDYSLVVLCVTSFCLILRDLVKRKRKWRFVNSDLTTDEIIPYLHQRKFGKFIDNFLDWSGTLEFSELSNEQIDWGYCLCWWLLLDIGELLVFSLFMRVVGREATTLTSQNIYYECSSLSDLQHLSVKVSKMTNPFYQKLLTILEKIMNCYCFCFYKQLQSLLKGYGKVITTRILRGAYRVSKGVAFVR